MSDNDRPRFEATMSDGTRHTGFLDTDPAPGADDGSQSWLRTMLALACECRVFRAAEGAQ